MMLRYYDTIMRLKPCHTPVRVRMDGQYWWAQIGVVILRCVSLTVSSYIFCKITTLSRKEFNCEPHYVRMLFKQWVILKFDRKTFELKQPIG